MKKSPQWRLNIGANEGNLAMFEFLPFAQFAVAFSLTVNSAPQRSHSSTGAVRLFTPSRVQFPSIKLSLLNGDLILERMRGIEPPL